MKIDLSNTANSNLELNDKARLSLKTNEGLKDRAIIAQQLQSINNLQDPRKLSLKKHKINRLPRAAGSNQEPGSSNQEVRPGSSEMESSLRNMEASLQNGYEGQVRRNLLSLNSGNLNHQDDSGKTILHYACEYQLPKVVKLLLDNGNSIKANFNPNIQDNNGDTPLMVATRHNYDEVAIILANSNLIEVNNQKEKNESDTALSLAIKNKNIAIVQALMSKKAQNGHEQVDLTLKIDKNRGTILHSIARSKDPRAIEMAKIILEPGNITTLKLRNSGSLTPLHTAVKHDNLEMVRLFVERFPELIKSEGILAIKENQPNRNTPLHDAVKKENVEIFKLLLRVTTKEDLEIKNAKGATPIDLINKIRNPIIQRQMQNAYQSFMFSNTAEIMDIDNQQETDQEIDSNMQPILQGNELQEAIFDMVKQKDLEGFLGLVATATEEDVNVRNSDGKTLDDLINEIGDENIRVEMSRILDDHRMQFNPQQEESLNSKIYNAIKSKDVEALRVLLSQATVYDLFPNNNQDIVNLLATSDYSRAEEGSLGNIIYNIVSDRMDVVLSLVQSSSDVGAGPSGAGSDACLPPAAKRPRLNKRDLRVKRETGLKCIDSREEEEIGEEEKKERIKKLFDNNKIGEKVKNIKFYDQILKISKKISEGKEVTDKEIEVLANRVKDVDLDFVDSEMKDIVKELKENIENKEEIKNIFRRSGVAEKIGKVAEGAGIAYTIFLVGKHLVHGDVEGLSFDALNLYVMPKIGEKISAQVMKLGEKLDSQVLKGFAPVIGRFVGNFFAFVGHGEAIKARMSATDPVDIKMADLNIATNSIFIAADIPALIAETAATAGIEVAAAASEFLGPIGAAVSVAAIIISDFIQAELQLERLEEHISLTDQERHEFYWDFFLGNKLPDYIHRDMEAKEIYGRYIRSIIDKFAETYDIIAMTLLPLLITKEKFLDCEERTAVVGSGLNSDIITTYEWSLEERIDLFRNSNRKFKIENSSD